LGQQISSKPDSNWRWWYLWTSLGANLPFAQDELFSTWCCTKMYNGFTISSHCCGGSFSWYQHIRNISWWTHMLSESDTAGADTSWIFNSYPCYPYPPMKFGWKWLKAMARAEVTELGFHMLRDGRLKSNRLTPTAVSLARAQGPMLALAGYDSTLKQSHWNYGYTAMCTNVPKAPGEVLKIPHWHRQLSPVNLVLCHFTPALEKRSRLWGPRPKAQQELCSGMAGLWRRGVKTSAEHGPKSRECPGMERISILARSSHRRLVVVWRNNIYIYVYI
jgi:uncharacterized protein (DUF2237 family)